MTSNNIYTSKAIKLMDETCGVNSDILMKNAAAALFNRLHWLNKQDKKICIVCGKGNNGGDGYGLACMLAKSGIKTTVVAVEPCTSELAKKQYNSYISSNGYCTSNLDEILNNDVIVDCIFGFSFSGELRGNYALAVNYINRSNSFIVSADLPSGIIADSDELPELYVKADITSTFTAYKLALTSYPSKSACGTVYVEDIGMPLETIHNMPQLAIRSSDELLNLLPHRDNNSHKGSYGTLVALCGSKDMCGAAAMACLAALKSGVGVLRLYTDKHCADFTRQRLFEPIICDNTDKLVIKDLRASALLIGCGCGREHDHKIKELLTQTELPCVLDADGINCIAGNIELYRSITASLVITPHPAEMGRLLGISANEVNKSRASTALSFANEYGFVTVLKGAATIIASPDGRLCVNTSGNTGLAKGGSGDILAGIISSLLAQGLSSFDAACLGVYLHGKAADILANQKGVYAMLPSELPDVIGQIMYFR